MTASTAPNRGGWRVARLVALAALFALVPLLLLTYFSLSLGTRAVSGEVKSRIRSTASLSAIAVGEEMRSLTELVDAYARRPRLSEAIMSGDGRELRRHLAELRAARKGIAITFLARPDGRLVDIIPATPAIVGKDFSFRDWYRGVTTTGRPYVSEAYRTQAKTHELVVAAAALVRDATGASRSRRVIGILVAAYSLDHIEQLALHITRAEHIELNVTDQRGVVVASPTGAPRRLVSQGDDRRVAAALAGRTGISEVKGASGDRLFAYHPVAGLGWTVTASVPADAAFAAASDLRGAVLTLVAVLLVVLLVGLAWFGRTLRARIRAENEARTLVQINRAVLDATPAGILLVDPEGRRLVDNAVFRALDGSETESGETIYERAEKSAHTVVDTPRFTKLMEAARQDPAHQEVETFETVNGTAFELYTAPVRDEDRDLGRIFTVRDVTAELEADRLKSELVATVSHELRTPLASILGFAELLTRRDLDEKTGRRYVSTIYGEAKRLTGLVNDFLDLQRIEEGSFSLALEPFDLAATIREQAEVFSGQSTAHSIEVEIEGGDELTLLGERERIAQVLANLISNAIKYSPDGGSVRVRAIPDGDVVRVSVTDSGLGIPADQQRNLFRKFFRVDSSDTRTIGGTGLGLALCRQIVEAHGGSIGFESVEGEGSTFWFDLLRPLERKASSNGHVLVVEDDAATASLLAEYLAGTGYGIEVAASGEQALARVAESPPLLICLDIALAGKLDGWQVLSSLKADLATGHIPVIVCTGGNGRQQASALGAADFVTKPFSQRRIREAIDRLLPGGRGSVLVVDDEASIRRLVVETLRGDGIELREAPDGEVALAEVARKRPDVIVLDLVMPKLDGLAVLERLQESPETRGISVVVLTAQRLSAETRFRLQQRAVALLEKSAYSPQELRTLVERALGGTTA